jgi:hypothetical protein
MSIQLFPDLGKSKIDSGSGKPARPGKSRQLALGEVDVSQVHSICIKECSKVRPTLSKVLEHFSLGQGKQTVTFLLVTCISVLFYCLFK